MQRIDINMSRYDHGDLVGDHGQFTVRGPDDMAYMRSAGRASIASTTAYDADRILLHVGPDIYLDHAVEVVIDRSVPRRTDDGGDAIGVILAWKTTGIDARHAAGCSTSVSGAPFTTETSSDESLGTLNHVRVVIEDDALKIVELRVPPGESTVSTTTLWSMDLLTSHRRIALRASFTDGQVTLWWNPLGNRNFEEQPIARVHSLIAGYGLVGLVAGRDGRFLEATFEYRTGTVSQPSHVNDVVVAGLNLTPVRLTVGSDLSRPSIATGISVEHAGDTRLPERQERVSRSFLRDARVLLRPGHTYEATAWIHTVDDQVVVVESKRFAVDGDAEDLSLRDCYGRQFPGAVSDESETTLSPVEILTWPEELAPSESITTAAVPGRVDSATAMDVTSRGVRRASLAPRTFAFPVLLNEQTREIARKFIQEAQGRVRPFIWTHPMTGEFIVCRLLSSDFSFKGAEASNYETKFELIEEPRCLGDTASSPGSPGYSGVNGYAPPSPPGTGACCLADHTCEILTALECERRRGTYLGDGSICRTLTCADGGGGGGSSDPNDPTDPDIPADPNGFDCDTDCGDACFPKQPPEQCEFCPQTSGGTGAALCGCQVVELGSCSNQCVSSTQCGTGTHESILRAVYCCFGDRKELLTSDTGGLSVQSWCCSHGFGCARVTNRTTCGTDHHCCAGETS